MDVEALDPKKHSAYIIERIAEFGDERASFWLLENFSREEILFVVDRSRRLSPKSASFWKLFVDKT